MFTTKRDVRKTLNVNNLWKTNGVFIYIKTSDDKMILYNIQHVSRICFSLGNCFVILTEKKICVTNKTEVTVFKMREMYNPKHVRIGVQ